MQDRGDANGVDDSDLPDEEFREDGPVIPDLAIPGKGVTLAAISVRTTADADLVEILVRLRAAGAEVVTVNSFPATKGEPGVTRVFDIELREFYKMERLWAEAPRLLAIQ